MEAEATAEGENDSAAERRHTQWQARREQMILPRLGWGLFFYPWFEVDRAAIHGNTRTAKFKFAPERGAVPGVGCVPQEGGFESCSTPIPEQPNEAQGDWSPWRW